MSIFLLILHPCHSSKQECLWKEVATVFGTRLSWVGLLCSSRSWNNFNKLDRLPVKQVHLTETNSISVINYFILFYFLFFLGGGYTPTICIVQKEQSLQQNVQFSKQQCFTELWVLKIDTFTNSSDVFCFVFCFVLFLINEAVRGTLFCVTKMLLLLLSSPSTCRLCGRTLLSTISFCLHNHFLHFLHFLRA